MSVHEHGNGNFGLGQLHMRVGPDEFVTRHNDYMGVDKNADYLYPRLEAGSLTCEEAARWADEHESVPYIVMLETVWMFEENNTYTDLSLSLRHAYESNVLSDILSDSRRAQQDGYMHERENQLVIPQAQEVNGSTYTLRVHVFLSKMEGNVSLRLVKKHGHTMVSEQYELADDDRHVGQVMGKFSDTPYSREYQRKDNQKWFKRGMGYHHPYVSFTKSTQVMPFFMNGRVTRSTLAVPLEVVYLNGLHMYGEGDNAPNNSLLCGCACGVPTHTHACILGPQIACGSKRLRYPILRNIYEDATPGASTGKCLRTEWEWVTYFNASTCMLVWFAAFTFVLQFVYKNRRRTRVPRPNLADGSWKAVAGAERPGAPATQPSEQEHPKRGWITRLRV